MATNLVKIIKDNEEIIVQLYEHVKKLKKDEDDLTPEGNLKIIHQFLRASFFMLAEAINQLLTKNHKSKSSPRFQCGFSINYYPKYKKGTIKKRVSIGDSGEEIHSFVFKNDHSNFILPNEVEYDNKDNYFKKLFLNQIEILEPNHPYVKLLDIFYNLVDYTGNTENKTKPLFSIQEYFGKDEGINGNNKKKYICFEIEDDIKKLLDTEYNIGEKYNYKDYANFLRLSILKQYNFRNTDLQIFWNGKKEDGEKWMSEELKYYQYCLSANDRFTNKSRGNLVCYTNESLDANELEDISFITDYFVTKLSELEYKFFHDYNLEIIKNAQLKTAIISILVDSFAHNISAHSLAALKWWIELRHKMLDKRFSVPTNLTKLNPHAYLIKYKQTEITTKKYYAALGLTDSSYDEGFYSLYDFIQFADLETSSNLMAFCETVPLYGKEKSNKKKLEYEFNPRFPVPIDYALFPFFRFLRDKGAFWSGVTRDVAYGGESKSWYQILWDDFANNPLYLGTIAKSEGITKVNIHLAIKDNKQWFYGHFLTIDMSIIEYEEKLSQSKEMRIRYDSTKLSLDEQEKISKFEGNIIELENGIGRGDLNKTRKNLQNYEKLLNKKYLNNLLIVQNMPCENCINGNKPEHQIKCEESNKMVVNSYSKYAFVRLGNCFNHFREILSQEKFTAFLPGGLIGEHAIFTIFENTLRNIKHYSEINSIKQEGIDLWIAVEETDLAYQKRPVSKESELFKVSVWLAHETKLFEFSQNKEKFYSVVLNNLIDSTIQPIVDDDGNPKMGGNSQDKACAAMLFNNSFTSVENSNKKRKSYYPWISLSIFLEKYKFSDSCSISMDSTKNVYVDNLFNHKKLKNTNVVNGYIKKSFHVWKSQDYLRLRSGEDNEYENISRFKFVITPSKFESEKHPREDGIIRLISEDLIGENFDILKHYERINKLYFLWLSKWIGELEDKKIILKKDERNLAVIKCENETIIYTGNNNNSSRGNNHLISFSHGGEDEENSCNVRSHGQFWSKFFGKESLKDPEKLNKYKFKIEENSLLFELFETIYSNVVIFDNRLNDRINSFSSEKRKVFQDQLLLSIFPEKTNIWDSFLYENKKKYPLILIMHLSFIEKLTDKNNKAYKESNINQFIEDRLKQIYSEQQEKFLFIITSGRGRDAWKRELTDKQKTFTLFKPVESLLSSIESGVSYNDNFDVKYNLLKTIIGS
ncbi:MAG: hypothetical protein P4L35_04410 [Ignavibacteriaceae bacterium]|nr:hypothetical protein [Ignavibacteriaceae bacterium]